MFSRERNAILTPRPRRVPFDSSEALSPATCHHQPGCTHNQNSSNPGVRLGENTEHSPRPIQDSRTLEFTQRRDQKTHGRASRHSHKGNRSHCGYSGQRFPTPSKLFLIPRPRPLFLQEAPADRQASPSSKLVLAVFRSKTYSSRSPHSYVLHHTSLISAGYHKLFTPSDSRMPRAHAREPSPADRPA